MSYTATKFADTIADLRKITPTAGVVVEVEGYYVTGDGGGGLFYGVTGGVYVDDGGMTIVVGSNAWKRVYDQGPINVLWYGAKNDITFDSTTMIQAAIDFVKPSSGSFPVISGGSVTQPRTIFIPGGNYLLSVPLKLYSFQVLTGDNESTYLNTSAGFVGTQMISLSNVASPTDRCFGAIVQNMTFKSTIANMYAIKTVSATVACLNCTFYNIWLLTERGFSFEGQNTIIQRIYSKGNLDQLVQLAGNINVIRDVLIDSGTSSSTDPIISIVPLTSGAPTSDVIIDHVTIEHTMNNTKTPIVISGSNGAYLSNIWIETALDNGYVIEANNSTVTLSDWMPSRLSTRGKIKVGNKSTVSLQYFSTDAEAVAWWNWFDVDATSLLSINNIVERTGLDNYRLDKSQNIQVGTFFPSMQRSAPVAGAALEMRPQFLSTQNLFVNPSFEAGRYGWVYSVAPTTENYIASAVNTGLMAELGWAGASCQIYQNVVISAAQVGKPVTVTALVSLTGGGLVQAMGAGIYNTSPYRAASDTGWQVLSATFYPTAAGTYGFGVYASGLTGGVSRLYLDEMSVSFSEETNTNSSRFGSIDMGAITIASAAVVPATGTWKQGDIVFNTAATAGGKVGWVCTTAGSPGTWKAFGAIDP